MTSKEWEQHRLSNGSDKRLVYPNKYSDMISQFGRPVPQLTMVVNEMIDKIDFELKDLIRHLNKPWLSADNLADAIHAKHCVKSVSIRSYSGPHFSRIFPHSD